MVSSTCSNHTLSGKDDAVNVHVNTAGTLLVHVILADVPGNRFNSLSDTTGGRSIIGTEDDDVVVDTVVLVETDVLVEVETIESVFLNELGLVDCIGIDDLNSLVAETEGSIDALKISEILVPSLNNVLENGMSNTEKLENSSKSKELVGTSNLPKLESIDDDSIVGEALTLIIVEAAVFFVLMISE